MRQTTLFAKIGTHFVLMIGFQLCLICFQLGCTSSDDEDPAQMGSDDGQSGSTSKDASTEESEWTNTVPYQGVIIKSAGHLPGTEKPEGVDVVSIATTPLSNTHVLSDKLVEELSALNVTTRIVEAYNCEELQCVFYSGNEDGSSELADLVIFASPIFAAELLFQVRKLVPKMADAIDQEENALFSALSSAGEPEASGQDGIDKFIESLVSEGYQTVPGRVVGFDAGVGEIDQKMGEFAVELVQGIQEL